MSQHTPQWVETIIKSLKEDDGRCVLFLGPEIPFHDTTSRYKTINALLEGKSYGSLVKVYEDDELLAYKRRLIPYQEMDFHQDMKNKYSELATNDIHKMVREIPFHTIISMTPDMNIVTAFKEKNYSYDFQFYNHRQERTLEIDKPTKSVPIIYNLMGSFNEEDSLVLDYGDFLDFILSISNQSKLPKNLIESLQNARNFIFLGFRLEKWYFKLLVRILGIHKIETYSEMPEIDNKMISVFTESFKFRFIELNAHEFLQNIYDECQRTDFVRHKINHKSKNEVYFNLLEKVNYEGCFHFLLDFYKDDSDERRRLLMLKMGWTDATNKYSTKLITDQYYGLEMARITNALIQYSEKIK